MMQRMLLSSSRLSCRVLATARTQRQITRTITGQERGKTPTAAEIKKNVPEFWVRKMKSFFAFVDVNGDGITDSEDYKMYETMLAETAAAMNVSKDRIEQFKKVLSELWMKQIGGGEYQWTENEFLETIFEVISRPGAEEYFRQAGSEMFGLYDLNQDGFISKNECAVILKGSPWTIVAFSSIDTNRNGKVSRKEFLKGYMDFWFDFADETNPGKYFVGPLLKM